MCLVAPPDSYIIPKYCHLFPISFPGPYFFSNWRDLLSGECLFAPKKKPVTQIEVDESEIIHHR